MSFLAARDVGSRTGGGGVASASQANLDRRERLRQLALETIDLQKVRSAAPPVRLGVFCVCVCVLSLRLADTRGR